MLTIRSGTCFLCLSGINHIDSSTSNRAAAFFIFQILEIPHLGKKFILDKFGNFTLCDPCMKRISKVQNLLEDLEKLEMEVLEEKYQIESQFKENSKSCPSSFVNGIEDFCKTEEFRTEIVQELKSNSIHSMLRKILKKQVGRKLNMKRVKIMKNISIPNIQVTEQLQFHNNDELLDNENEKFVNQDNDSRICQSNSLSDENVYPPIQPNCPDDDHQEEMESNSEALTILENIKIDTEPPDSHINSGEDPFDVANSHELNSVLEYTNVAEVSSFQYEVKPNISGDLPNNMVFQYSNTEVNNFGNVEVQEGSIPDQSRKIEKRFVCGTCGTNFKYYNLMIKHCRTHEIFKIHPKCPSKRRYKCNFKEKAFRKSSDAKMHESKHTLEEPYNFKLFEKTFNETVNANARRHERTHTGEKPHKHYKCKFCEKTFSDSSNAKTHERTHTGEKPYKCKYCEKTFSHSSATKEHERRHTGEKPYICKFCGKRFYTSSDAKSHERTHTREKPYNCKFCEKTFSTLRAVKKHGLLHIEEKAV